MQKVRLGIVGVGGVGAARVDEALQTPEAEVVALCDVNETNLKTAAAKAPRAALFRDANELFAARKADAIVLIVPHFLHAALALEALNAGLHVLIEKPMAIRLGECNRMLAAAQASGRILTVHHQFQIRQRHLAALMRSGAMGKLVRATYIANNCRNNAYYRSAAWRGKWKTEGGGVLINQAIHDIDAFVQLAGLPCEISARLGNQFHDIEVEDTCVASLRYPDGGSGLFAANVSSLSTLELTEFEGEKGILKCGKPSRFGRLPGNGVYDFFDAREAPMFAPRPEAAWQDVPEAEPFEPGTLVRDFVQAVQQGRAPLVDPRNARDAVHFFNAIVLSHFLEKPMKLPLDPAEVDRVFDALAAGQWKLNRSFAAPA